MDEFLPPPPPAYEVSQQDFDRKISEAVEVSRTISSHPDRKHRTDDDEWEAWDEAAFEAAVASYTASASNSISAQQAQSSSSTSSAIQPLNIQKKLHNRPPEVPHQQNTYPPPNQSSPSSATNHPSPANHFRDHSRDISPPPPPFTAVGPSLDGPPFTEVATAYHGNDSAPPSPLSSPTQPTASIQIRPQSEYVPVSRPPPPPAIPVRQSLPASQRAHNRTGLQASNSFTPQYGGRMDFDPALAYGAPRRQQALPSPPPPRVVDAAAFYNSAVSSHLKSGLARPTNQPNRYSTNVANRQSSYGSVSYASNDSMSMRGFEPPTSFPQQQTHSYLSQNPALSNYGQTSDNSSIRSYGNQQPYYPPPNQPQLGGPQTPQPQYHSPGLQQLPNAGWGNQQYGYNRNMY